MDGCTYWHLFSACTHTCPKDKETSHPPMVGDGKGDSGVGTTNWHYQFHWFYPINFYQINFTHWKNWWFWNKQLGYIIIKFYARPRYRLQGRSNISILHINYICVEYKTAIPHKFSWFSGQLFQHVPLKLRFSSYLLLKHPFLLSSARPDYIVRPSETKGTISSEHSKPTTVPKD